MHVLNNLCWLVMVLLHIMSFVLVNGRPLSLSTRTNMRVKDQLWTRGGNVANTSVVLSQLGELTEFLGTLAQNALTQTVYYSQENFYMVSSQTFFTYPFFTMQRLMVEDLHKYGVHIDHCIYHEKCNPPVSCVINISTTGTRTILHGNRSLPEVKYKDFELLNLHNYKWIHFEGRNIQEVLQMINRVDKYNTGLDQDPSSRRIQISVELEKPKLQASLKELLPRIDVVFISKDFAKSHGCANGEDCIKMFFKSIKQGGQIVCAWGELGAWAIEPTGVIVHSPAYPHLKWKTHLVQGDTFNAGVIYFLCRGNSLLDAITHGCKVAGDKIGQQGFKIEKDTP